MKTYDGSWWWVRQKKHMALVLITITMILQFQMKGCVGCVETERMGLLQLKSYLNFLLSGEEESILKSWSHDASNMSDCCLWERVKCSDAIGGHISMNEIMPSEDLDAPLSLNLSLIHSFPQLQSLNFSSNGFNHLFDPIHGYKSFQRLEKLRTLDFSGNHLNNNVLPFLTAAKSLRTLNLGFSGLEGVFPPNELTSMTELRVLNLHGNRFSSFSIQSLINFRELEVLDISYNSINGVKAGDGYKSFQRLEKLRILDLSYNRLNDSVLPFLSAARSLRTLNLGSNELEGVFPLNGYSKICALMNLRELDLSNNTLTSMPSCLGNLSRLRTLDLSDNQLNGNLSSFVSGLPSALEYLSLLDNNFNGSFLFNSLVNQTRLQVFRLSTKVGMIQAQAESSWVPLFQLKVLKLQNFILGSTIPGFLIHQHDLCYVDLSYNKLTGAFPTWLVQNNTRLQIIFLNSNSLTELQLRRLGHGLQFLDISSNRIYDSIQEDIGLSFQS